MLQKARSDLHSFFMSGKTLDVKFRAEQLRKLGRVIVKNEKRILRALALDLRKPVFEGSAAEVGQVLNSISFTLKNLKSWTTPQKTKMPFYLLPGKARTYAQPYGKVLIFSPWNYPFALTVNPLIGALAAGNVVIAKPSELSAHTSTVLREIFSENFDPDYIRIIEGETQTAEELLELQWDYIFFTGSARVGKSILKKAAEHLTPVSLELGGKSPAWVDATSDLKVALKRIFWGKFLNAGQTCVAPDYLLLHQKHESAFRALAPEIIREFFGSDPQTSTDFGRIISSSHTRRLVGLLQGQQLLCGGEHHVEHKYLSPTVVLQPSLSSPLMQEEIFGPILPVITYADEHEVYRIIEDRPTPLALYLFSDDKVLQNRVIERLPFGGGIMNDVIVHLGVEGLPFGGIGTSGMGRYHGKYSFDTFSHLKGVLHRTTWPDPDFRYPPYKEKFLRFLR